MTSGNPTLTKVMINSIDVTNYLIKWESSSEYEKVVGSVTIEVSKAIDSVLSININSAGQSVTIQRGVSSATEEYVFRGEIIDIDLVGNKYIFTCADKYYEAVRTEVTTTYDKNIDPETGVISDIFISLITENTSLTADATSVQDSGTELLLDKFVCNHVEVFERTDTLSNALNWQHYYDPIEDKVFFEPKGYITKSDIFEVGTTIVQQPVWRISTEGMINKLTVQGAEQEVQTTVYADGDNTEGQTVELSKTPVSMKVYVGSGVYDPSGSPATRPSDTDANLLTGGKIGSTSGSFDYEYDDDPNIKTVYFYDSSRDTQPSYTPVVGTSNIEIQYTNRIPAPVLVSDSVSITNYGLYQKTHTREDVKTVSDAEVYARKTLEYFKNPFTSTTLKVSGISDIKVGRSYRCIDGQNGIDNYYTVMKLKKTYPFQYDEVTVGDRLIRTSNWELETVDRIKRLEELQTSSQDLLVHVSELNREIEYERRYMKMQKKSIAGDTGIYGSSTYGLYGTAKYGSSLTNNFILGSSLAGVLGTNMLGEQEATPITVKLLQGNNIYKEFLYDDDFYDSGNSTGTWDTSNKRLDFTSGQVIQTDSISIGIEYSWFKVELGNLTGSVLIEISGDGGSNWQTVNVGARTLFIDRSTSGVLLKITENNSSTARIENTYKADGSYDDPAIKITLEE